MKTQNNRIRLYQQIPGPLPGFDPVWPLNIIPQTTNLSSWDNSTTWKHSIQAYHALEKVDEKFQQKINYQFANINIGTQTSFGAFASRSSIPKTAFIVFGLDNGGILNGPNFALYDIVAHELGHCYLFNNIDYDLSEPNAVLHEGIADIIGTYVENFILPNGTDWIAGGEEPSIKTAIGRNHQIFSCYTDYDLTDTHQKSRAISNWFYSISDGIPSENILSLGIEQSKNITLEAVNRITDSKASVYTFKNI
ncbi:MAG: hypothetical protein IPO92_20240 [Saprospiraceae bacterium]|nr:hypothetical protein [Saprospiraceae bacterium]